VAFLLLVWPSVRNVNTTSGISTQNVKTHTFVFKQRHAMMVLGILVATRQGEINNPTTS
jgi:hypothetical protein